MHIAAATYHEEIDALSVAVRNDKDAPIGVVWMDFQSDAIEFSRGDAFHEAPSAIQVIQAVLRAVHDESKPEDEIVFVDAAQRLAARHQSLQ